MVLASPKETKGLFKNGAVRIPVGDINIQEVNSIYQRLRGIRVNGKPILDGQTTVHGNMVVMNFSGLPIEEFAQKIHEQLQGDYNVTIDDVYSNLIEEKEYNYGDPKSDPRGDRGVLRERSRTLRSEASKLLNQRIGQAERGRFSLRPTEPAGGPSTGGGLVLGKSKQPNAASYTGIHYGKERVNSLAGGFYGTGIKGSEAKRLRESQDPRIKRRVYFYIPDTDLGGRMPRPEGGLGQHVYRQSFDNILPPGEEMTRLYNEAGRDSNDFESAVIDAGYDGYAIPSMGMMVVMNHNVPVNYLGDRDDVKGTVSVDGQLFSLRATDTPEFKQWLKAQPEAVRQVKGKGNKKPNARYIEFGQDFIASKNWSDIQDLDNLDIVPLKPMLLKNAQDSGFNPQVLTMVRDQPYVTKEEFNRIAGLFGGMNKYAAGGEVTDFIKRAA